jgi:hypothetical protein
MKESNDDLLDQIHATRAKIYEEIKDMTASERATYINAKGAEIEKKYGIKAEHVPAPTRAEAPQTVR